MNLNYDHFRKLDDTDLYLCNPDGKELGVVDASDVYVTIRFNDLSMLEFTTSYYDDGVYDMIEANRLVFLDNIGWFKIIQMQENVDGVKRTKSVTASSLQCVFQKMGFRCADSVYKFYDPNDETDESYSNGVSGSIPSVVGQMCRQHNIGISLYSSPGDDYWRSSEWTITYITPSLFYNEDAPVCRAMQDEAICFYDWMVNRVEEAFSVVFYFDFLSKTIQIKTASEATVKSDLCLSFNNFMNSVDVSENSDNITTVLSCSGGDVDISLANPTGTNYIVDFSYYKNNNWMSAELIDGLNEWEQRVNAETSAYKSILNSLSKEFLKATEVDTILTSTSLMLEDMKNARDLYITGEINEQPDCVYTRVETIEIGSTSIDSRSPFYVQAVTNDSRITAYETEPLYNASSHKWEFSGHYVTGSVQTCVVNNCIYFSDTNGDNFCRLIVGMDAEEHQFCQNIDRYELYENIGRWIGIQGQKVSELTSEKSKIEANVESLTNSMRAISDRTNIISYFSSRPDLLHELRCYWMEAEYVNDNIAFVEGMNMSDRIALSEELMEAGVSELSKLCQPQRTFSISSNNFIGRGDFLNAVSELNVGSVPSVEIDDGLWYYPALMEIKFKVDGADSDMSMTFSNKSRLDDWGYTYADLISKAASASRSVSSNWRMLTEYSKDKDSISELIKNPLDGALRAMYANAKNQEFIVDSTGVTGRKLRSEEPGDGDVDPLYEDEQLRMINNMLLFTDDGWKSTKAAIGKIINPDGSYSYGIIADVIVGDLIVGENLRIANDTNSVTIDKNGITILKDGYPVFYADDNGNLHLVGDIKTSNIDVSGGKIVIPGTESGLSRSAVVTNGGVYLTNNKTGEVDGESNNAIFIGHSGIDLLVGSANGHAAHSVASARKSGTGVQYSLAGSSIIVTPTQRRLVGEWQVETAASSTAVVSDRNRKDNIDPMPDIYSDLHELLRPVVYTYKDGDSGRTHTGFIAQDIEDSLQELGLTTQEFAAICYDVDEDGEKVNYGVRYDEIVALNTKEIQRLSREIKVLREQLSALVDGANSVDKNITKEE